ncbi:MAG: FAD-dependent oxidoreductase [Pirellulaceae bacterium]
MNDFVIVGGGIVGLTTAWELIGRFPAARIVVLEERASSRPSPDGP